MAIFEGAGVAIVTPMHADGSINYDKFEELIEEQIAGGTDCIIAVGTTGEGSTLTEPEHIDAIRFAVEVTKHRIPVIGGTGSNSTASAIQYSTEAEEAGFRGNIPGGLATVPVNVPPEIDAVYNSSPFHGGFDEEALRSKAYVVNMNGRAKRLHSWTRIDPGAEIYVPLKKKQKNEFNYAAMSTIATTASTLATMAMSIITIINLTKK